MNAFAHLARCAIGALLLALPAAAQDGPLLPPACDTLRALSEEALAAPARDFQTTQARADSDTVMSLCTALDDTGLPVATLLLRQDISASPPQPAQAQRDALIAELASVFGQDPDTTFPDIGEAALYVKDTGQLTAWYRAGRVMFIVTASGPDADVRRAMAERIARAIVTRFQ